MVERSSKKLNGREFIIETGRIAKQADSAVTIQLGGTVVLVTCVCSKEAREDVNFFPLMGNLDYISSPEGKKDQYVLSWFDDREDDFNTVYKKLTGVKFSSLSSVESARKRIYDISFEALAGKIQ